MIWNIKITDKEKRQIKKIIKEDYWKKFKLTSFNKDYMIYLSLPEFSAMWNIYDEENKLKENYKDFNKWVHYIMRLVASYHINQAMKALKFDTMNDVNLLSNDRDWNIWSFWRVAKVWWWDKLDNSTFSEFGDWRFVPSPRLAKFPVESFKVKGSFSKTWKVFIRRKWKIDEKLDVSEILKWVTKVLKFRNEETWQVWFSDKVDRSTTKLININLYPDQEIVRKEISNNWLSSTCSHHFLPFFINWEDSKIVIAYKPYKYLLWISKITRLIQFCLNRPSLQEWSTDLIYKEIAKAAGTEDVFVSLLNITHTCELTRWAAKETSTTTEKAGGCFKDEQLRNNML